MEQPSETATTIADGVTTDSSDAPSVVPIPVEEFPAEPDGVTALHDLIAGGVAGSASVIVGHPFDTIKVRLQTSSAPSGSLMSTVASFGGISSLFRGLMAPLSAAAAINAVIFASYGASSRLWDEHITKQLSPSTQPKDQLDEEAEAMHDPWQKAFVCGSFAGLVQCTLICPMEHIKCRLQVQHGKGAADNVFSGPFSAASRILKDYGISGLYRGWWCTTLREVPAFGLYFATYDFVKDRANKFFAERAGIEEHSAAYPHHTHTWFASAFAGGTSGALTWAIIYPVDVIKSRIQTAPLDTPRDQIRMWNVGRDIVAQHGWRYMFRGLGVTLIRAFPVNGIIFPVYEFTLLHITNLD